MRKLIYGSLSVAFLALCVLLLAIDSTLPGFNKYVPLGVSALMAVITYLAATSANKQSSVGVREQHQNSWAFYGKLVFGSYAVAIAIFMLLIVSGLWLFGVDKVQANLLENSQVVLFGLAVLAAPVLWKRLR